MNPIQAVSSDDQNVVEFSENPGRRLRVQRQSRGIEIERIAAQLHLRVATVEALEQDRYQDLPGPVFVTGYLRNYARLLGLDAEPLIAAFRTAHPDPEPVGLRVSPLPRQEIGSSHILVRLISLALLAAVVTMLALWWQNRAELLSSLTPGDASGLALTTPANTPPPLDQTSAPATQGAAAAGPALPLPAATGAGPEPERSAALALPPAPPATQAQGPAVATPDAPPDATRTGATAEPAAGTPNGPPGEVAMSFSAATWINVRDATGALILKGQMRKGDTRVLAGSPPYAVVIGNAAALGVTVDGRPVDLAGRARGKDARFKFDPRSPE
ncbi:RodZ domain-containing protein [Candidatus Thiodictyon syntrophicum]|jgi:cytoskeleton protein RodZ|uniref:Cytoskeleton protein RodZ-like C-terminal domain-containing protein n=1 Tax=Candidatus Thiodictyon syntrophicum TaxID=1166950 RepID=A0A2K8U5G2_9GAMM|nr:RodZ family helix-turn-helix domain-containing protein [Candidatus Thiodictyon syntrophicum]AUB80822.1 hypothetical protein THSYN_07560 [Candidatus Thiodictyon syntrophicum]